MYSELYDKARSDCADIVMCDATTKYDDKPDEPDTITQLSGSCVLEKTEIYPSLLMEMAGAAWRCIYKRELIIGSRVEFPSGIKLAEDRIFNILAFGYANKLAYIKKSYYNRFVRKGSAVNKYYPDMLDVILKARTGVMDALDTAWDGSKEYKDTYENQTVAHSLAAINNEFYKDARGSFSQRYKKIKKLCSTPEIRKAIQITNRDDVRLKLIIKRRVLPLCAVAIILNKKHGR